MHKSGRIELSWDEGNQEGFHASIEGRNADIVRVAEEFLLEQYLSEIIDGHLAVESLPTIVGEFLDNLAVTLMARLLKAPSDMQTRLETVKVATRIQSIGRMATIDREAMKNDIEKALGPGAVNEIIAKMRAQGSVEVPDDEDKAPKASKDPEMAAEAPKETPIGSKIDEIKNAFGQRRPE